MSSWLSVGKSYKAAVLPVGNVLADAKSEARIAENDHPSEKSLRKRISDGRSDDDRQRKKQKEHKEKKSKDKKKDRKKDKKAKKNHKDKSHSSTALVPHNSNLPNPAIRSRDDLSSSESDFSSSDEEAQFNSTRRIIRENKAEIMSGHSELTFLPNGEVVLLPKYATTESGVSWNIDSRKDNTLLLYDGLPGDVLYTIHHGAVYYTSPTQLPATIHQTHNVHTTTSAQLYRHTTQRPSGIVVPAKQLKDYANASALAQIFMHRTQLLSEARRETKLSHKHRYFNSGVRSVLEDVNVSRLWMRGEKSSYVSGSTDKSNGTGNVNVMLAFPFIEPSVLSDLGYTVQTSTLPSTNTNNSSIPVHYATPAASAQTLSNNLTRTTNILLRTCPHDVRTVLQCVYIQDSVCIAQHIAGGRGYKPLHTMHNKQALLLQKSATERKISILEESIQASSEHNKCISYEHLVRLLLHTKQVDKVTKVLQQAIVDRPASVRVHLLQYNCGMGVFNGSDYNTLLSSVRSVYNSIALAWSNQLAANSMLHDSTYANYNTASLQQQYQQILLEQQLVQLQCDTLLYTLQLERSSGNVEKAVAMVQALLDFNLSDNMVTVDDYCTYWDSECGRIGEDYTTLPCAYMVERNSVNSSGGGSSGGYDAWVRSGRPSEPMDSDSDATTPHYLRDDIVSVSSTLDSKLNVSGFSPGTDATVHDTTNVPHTGTGTCISVDDSATISSLQDQNAIAADYFLQQMLSSENSANDDTNSGDNIQEEGDTMDIAPDMTNTINTTNNTLNTTKNTYASAITPSDPHIPDTTNPTTTTANDEPESEMVYSRLHGYKIKVTKENTGTIYKKILTEMGGVNSTEDGSDGTINVASSSTNSGVYEPTATILSTIPTHEGKIQLLGSRSTSNSTLQALQNRPYRYNVYTAYTQYRPLRATSSIDSVSVEQQPERVIFSADIQDALFQATFTSTSSIIDTAMQQQLRQKVVVRCLQSMGVVFHNTCSHSLHARNSEFMAQNSNRVLCAEDRAVYEKIMNTTNAASSTTNINTTNTATTTNTMHMLLNQLISAGDNTLSICTVTPYLLQKHVVCVKLGLDSELNFVIRLMHDVISRCSSVDSLLSAEFVNQLRCALVRLLTLRCQAEQCLYNSSTITSNASQLLWREQCRAILQTTVPTTTITTGTSTNRTSANTIANTTSTSIPAVGSLALWAEYLQGEVALGNSAEAVKMADKVLKSLQPNNNSTNSDTSGGCVQYAGIEKFTHTVVQLALHSTNSTSSTDTTIHTALCLLTQFAHSYVSFHPSHGRYSGELKPPKQTKSSGKNSAAVLTHECIQGAVEVLQQSVLDAVGRLQEQILKERRARNSNNTYNKDKSTANSNGGVSVEVEECSQLEYATEIYHLVHMMAWLQYLSTLYTESATYSTAIHKLALHDEAVQLGDRVYSAAIDLLSEVVFPEFNTTGTRSSTNTDQYSRFFKRFLPTTNNAPTSLLVTDSSTSSPVSSSNSIASAQYFNHSTVSECEVGAVVLIEQLHCARVPWLLSAGSGMYNSSTNNSSSRAVDRRLMCLSQCAKHTLYTALRTALDHFPLNTYLQTVFCTINTVTPGGMVQVRAYYRGIAHNRQLWGGGLQACEIVNMFRMEIYAANNALLCDPLNTVQCRNVYAVFGTYDIYNICSEEYDSNTTHPLTLCRYWSADSVLRVRTFLETTLSSASVASHMPILWVYYIFLECSQGRNTEAKRVFFRAVSVCGWSQYLFTLCYGPLRSVFSEVELTSMSSMMEQRGLHGLRGAV